MQLQSKTIIGLILILAISCIMALTSKLTPELVDIIKWVGTAFMGVRGIANYTESKNAS